MVHTSILTYLAILLPVLPAPEPPIESQGMAADQQHEGLETVGRRRRPMEFYDDGPAVMRADQPRLISPPGDVTFNGFTSVQVNVDANGNNLVGDAANEPSIAVDPTNPNHMVIGWRQFDTIESNFRQAGRGWSHDGGRTWHFPGVLEPGVFRSDPILETDAAGNFYYNSLTNDETGYWCKVFKSSDGGVTFDTGTYAYGGDKAWMAIDRTLGVGAANIYEAWDYAGCCGDDWFSRSTNGNASYETPVPIPDRPIWGLTAVGPDGEVYVTGRLDSSSAAYVVVKSTTMSSPDNPLAFDFSVIVDLGGLHRFSLESGPNPGGLHGNVVVAVDHSSTATRGYVYVLASVDPPGLDPMEVHLIRSTDGGVSWSEPIRVNDGAFVGQSWQWMGMMDVAPNGRLDALWNDTRDDPAGLMSQLRYSYSTDAGSTWSASVPVGPSFNPHLGWPNQNKLGDYYDMQSDLVGAHVAYAATYNGEQDVYYLRVGEYDCNSNGVGDATEIAGGAADFNQNGIPDTCDGFSIPATSPAALIILAAGLLLGGIIIRNARSSGTRFLGR
jgi:hypothetical protein